LIHSHGDSDGRVSACGAPEAGVADSHGPPESVCVDTLKFMVPVPMLLTAKFPGGTTPPDATAVTRAPARQLDSLCERAHGKVTGIAIVPPVVELGKVTVPV